MVQGQVEQFQTGVVAAYTAAGAIKVQSGLVTLGGASAQAYTLVAPASGPQAGGGQDGIEMEFSVISAHAHTLTTPANGINGAYDTVTFAAVADAVVLKASAGVWYRVGGAGTNTMSEVEAMADKWMQGAAESIKSRGTKGVFKRAAEHAGKSTHEYAEEKKHSKGKIGKRARLALAFASAKH